MGTDHLGRDILSRIIFGARVSMFVGLGAATLQLVMVVFIGVISGYFGGKVDIVIQRFVDAVLSIPALFFYLTMMAVVGSGVWQVIIVLGVLRGIRGSRIPRSAVIGVMENVYVDAARTIGASSKRIILKHIMPNVTAPILIQYTVSLGQVILTESTLSFLGFGIPPPTPSWGGMLSGAGRQYMYDAPWMALWPGLALGMVVYGFNMLGDALRDLLDPRLRGGLGRYSGVTAEKPKK